MPVECAQVPETPFEALLKNVFDRVNVASGPYQMVSMLADGIVFVCDSEAPGKVNAEYLEEVPVA